MKIVVAVLAIVILLSIGSSILFIGKMPPAVNKSVSQQTSRVNNSIATSTTAKDESTSTSVAVQAPTENLGEEENCTQQLNSFQERVKAQLADIPQDEATNFVIGYSPSLNTCVGGFEIDEDTGNVGNGYEVSYYIENVLTNSDIDEYEYRNELAQHPELIQQAQTQYSDPDTQAADEQDAAEGQADMDYAKELSSLTNGEIQVQLD